MNYSLFFLNLRLLFLYTGSYPLWLQTYLDLLHLRKKKIYKNFCVSLSYYPFQTPFKTNASISWPILDSSTWFDSAPDHPTPDFSVEIVSSDQSLIVRSNWIICFHLPFTWSPYSLILILSFLPWSSFLLILLPCLWHTFIFFLLAPFPLSSPYTSTLPLVPLRSSFYKLSQGSIIYFCVFNIVFPMVILRSYFQDWPHAGTPPLVFPVVFWYFKFKLSESEVIISRIRHGTWHATVLLKQRRLFSRSENSFQAGHFCLLPFPLENSKPGRCKLIIPIPTYLENLYQFCNYRKQITK